jgi:ACT domain-containing protein
MPKKTNIDILKKQLIEALEKSLGVVTTAVKIVGIHRSTFYNWYNDDEEFRKEVDSIGDIATIFYLKTKGKRRGYIERQEITGADGSPTSFKIEIIDTGEDSDE